MSELLTMNETLTTFKGSDLTYTEIAFRGKETLGINLAYGVNPMLNVGFLAVRFVCLVEEPYLSMATFKRFTPRNPSNYTKEEKKLTGIKLNRLVIPFLGNAKCPHLIRPIGDKLQIWPVISSWIAEVLEAEGFILSVLDLTAFVQNQFEAPEDGVDLIMKLPDIEQGMDDSPAPAPGTIN